MTSITKDKLKKPLSVLAAVLFWLAVWYLLSLCVGSELLLPSPVKVVKRLCLLGATSEFWKITLSSVLRIALGFIGGVLAGTVFAVIGASSRHLDAILSPLGTVVRATPVASFIILALVWIKADKVPSFIAFLMVTPIVWGALKAEITSTDRKLLEAARVYRLSFFGTVKAVYLPHVLPGFTASVITSLGLSWKAGIAAEVLCTPDGAVGTMLYDSKVYLETVDLFAWTLTVIILSVIMEAVFKSLLRRVGGTK